MPRLGIVHFDEDGALFTTEMEVTDEQMKVNCWLPVRFFGGSCESYQVCSQAKKANCKAAPLEVAHN
jgi:hypothetical protein